MGKSAKICYIEIKNLEVNMVPTHFLHRHIFCYAKVVKFITDLIEYTAGLPQLIYNTVR